MGLALRLLRKRPVASTLAALTLGLGEGTTTAMFSVVHAVLLSPLPFPQPEQLLIVHESLVREPEMNVSWADYQDWRNQTRAFSNLGDFKASARRAFAARAAPSSP